MKKRDLTPEQARVELERLTGRNWTILEDYARDVYAYQSEAVIATSPSESNHIVVIKDPHRIAQIGPKPGWALSTSSADMFNAVGETFVDLVNQPGVLEYLTTGESAELPIDYRGPWDRAPREEVRVVPPPRGLGFLGWLFGMR